MTRSFRLAALIALAPAAAFVPAAAVAHAHLVSATPGVDSTIKTAPTEIAIDFTEGVEPSLSGIAVLDPGGTHVEMGAPHTGASNKHLAIGVKPLSPGLYTVQWHATAVDTHKTEGSFHFTFGG